MLAFALTACAPASVTPAPAPTFAPTREAAPTQAPSPGGAQVQIQPTWTPRPTDVIPTLEPLKCPNLKAQPREMTFAPISNKADIIAYTGKDGVFAFDVSSQKSSLIISKTDEISLGQLAWSPDRKYLALVRSAHWPECAGHQLILADVTFGAARVIQSDDAPIKVLAWMQDSNALTVQDSRGVVNITPNAEMSAKPLPINERVAQLEWVNVNNAWYIRENPNGEQNIPLTLLQLNPLTVRPMLEGQIHHISLSPNKKLLAVAWYDTKKQIDVLDILDPGAATLTVKTIRDMVGFTSVEWSPDSKAILIGFGMAGLLLVEATPNGAEKQMDFYGKPGEAAWNRDGSRFIVTMEGDISKEPPWVAIYTLKTNQLDQQPAYVWSPWEIVWRK